METKALTFTYRLKELGGILFRESSHEIPEELKLCDTPERTARIWREGIEPSPRFTPGVENVVVLLLNARRRVTFFQIITTGTIDTCLVHPREVFRAAILQNAAAMVIMHNHPSGDPTPSEADIRITRDMIRAGQLLKIDLLDHVIIGAPNSEGKYWRSLRELGYFYS